MVYIMVFRLGLCLCVVSWNKSSVYIKLFFATIYGTSRIPFCAILLLQTATTVKY